MTLAIVMLGVLAAVAAFWAMYLLLLPSIAFSRERHLDQDDAFARHSPSLAVIIPAHNMERFIARCVRSILACQYPRDRLQVFVVADNCADETAERAEAAGAEVLCRVTELRGKTYALAWGIEELESRGIDSDVFVIVDATVEVSSGFLGALADRVSKGEHIVVGHAAVHPGNRQWFAQCLGLSLAHRNLQNASRDRLGLSSLIEGRGMAYSRDYINRHGWSLALPEATDSGSHPTEDWRHGVRAVEHGYRVAYERQAKVYTPFRESLGEATRQGVRWERGRAGNALTYGVHLWLRGVRKRSPRMIIAALDAMQPPVAILGGLSAAVAALALAFHAGLGVMVPVLCSAPLLLVILYAIAVLRHANRDGISPWTVLWAPVYVGWRCAAFVYAIGTSRRGKTTESVKPGH
jgi:1,2-diacylglycerol 3-beta-glucosyltransferase